MKKIYIYFNLYLGFGIILLLAFSSCVTTKTTSFLQDKSPVYTSRPFKDYRLQYSDEITCRILTSNSDFSDVFNSNTAGSSGDGGEIGNIVSKSGAGNSYIIYDNGNISIPFFGDIQVVNRTIAEAEEIVQNRMRQAFPDAQVKISLKNNSYFVVSSEINGQFPIYKDNMTIFQAMAINGRPSTDLDIGKIKIVRTDENTGLSVVKMFDVRSESIIESEFYYIKPNDIIYYSTSKRAFFRIDSFMSLLATITLPISVVATVLAIKVK